MLFAAARRQTKVSELNVAATIEKNVVGFDVTIARLLVASL